MKCWASGILALVMLSISAQVLAEIKASVLEYGYYQNTMPTQRIRNDDSPSGYERSGGEVRLAKQTQQIPMAKGLLFGFRFQVSGFPKDQVAAKLVLKVTHPEMVRPDGSKRNGYSYPIPMQVWDGKIIENTGYRFDKNFELVEGDWRFEYWHEDKMLFSQTFQVVKQVEALPLDLLREAKRQPATTPSTASSVVNNPAPPAPVAQQPVVPQPVAQKPVPQNPVPQQPEQKNVVKAAEPVKMLKPVTLQSAEQATAKAKAEGQASQASTKPATPALVSESQVEKPSSLPAGAASKLSPEFQKKISDIMNKYKSKSEPGNDAVGN